MLGRDGVGEALEGVGVDGAVIVVSPSVVADERRGAPTARSFRGTEESVLGG